MTIEAVRPEEMELHSDLMKPPFGVLVLLHHFLVRACIMREAVGTPEQRNMYVASTIITPWRWLLGRGRWKLFRRLNKKLRDGGSAGETFRQAPELDGVQNRLDKFEVPAKRLPARLRRKADPKDSVWLFEVYELGGILRGVRRFLQYGVFGEFRPKSVPLPKKRVALGSRLVWWLAGRPCEYAIRLKTQDAEGAPPRVLEAARAVGKAKARALLPVLLLLAVFTKEKTTA
jgi:hypothetical protein